MIMHQKLVTGRHLIILNLSMQHENGRVVNIWSSLSLAKSIVAIIGWILIGLRPTEDLLYDQLVEMEKYKVENN